MGDYQLLRSCLLTGAALVAVGFVGLVARRNFIALLVAAGVMTLGIVLICAGFGVFHDSPGGEAIGLTALGVFALAAVIGLSLAHRAGLDIRGETGDHTSQSDGENTSN